MGQLDRFPQLAGLVFLILLEPGSALCPCFLRFRKVRSDPCFGSAQTTEEMNLTLFLGFSLADSTLSVNGLKRQSHASGIHIFGESR